LPEPFSPDHLNQLRQRWERDPKSRAFLQLAEEYRRAGRLPDAVHVLRAGLKEHPSYLAAQVALGRCLVESSEPEAAVEILERAVARDPTQLVANKLLVEAYLAKGQAGKARERLDLYKLFNDRDAEIEPLENRIRALEGLPPATLAVKRGIGAPPVAAPALFDLPAPATLPELDLTPVLPSRRPSGGASPREPFGELFAPDAVQRIESMFVRQGIFPLAPPLAAASLDLAPFPQVAPPEAQAGITPSFTTESLDPGLPPLEVEPPQTEALPVAATAREWESEAWPDGSTAVDETPPAPEPLAVAAEEADLAVVPFDWEPEADAPPLPISAAPKAASATLGELYLAQGHLEEAEESFNSVLQARPGDAAALAGLESVRQQRGDEAAAFADEAPTVEESNLIVGGLTTRKAALLKDYLARIRRGAQHHVS